MNCRKTKISQNNRVYTKLYVTRGECIKLGPKYGDAFNNDDDRHHVSAQYRLHVNVRFLFEHKTSEQYNNNIIFTIYNPLPAARTRNGR